MRYSKIVRNNMLNKKSYIIIFISCFIFVLSLGINTIKGTRAGFGCLTACMNAPYKVIYSSNYPDGIDSLDDIVKPSCTAHKVFDNLFDTPSSYVFIGWNTSPDGTGTSYYAFSCITISENITLYAQWSLLPVEEEKEEIETIVYGDLNDNGSIDEDDYKLLEKYLLGDSILDEEKFVSADVNGDSNIDEVDVDIIKQVYLGTDGYDGYLPNNIVPIYSLYEETVDEDNDESSNEDNESDSSVNSGSTNSGGNNASGSGSGTSGNSSSSGSGSSGGSGSKPSGGTSSNKKPSSNKENNNKEDNSESEEKLEEDKKIPVIYNFKFMLDGNEYDNTKCETIKDSTCELVLPNKRPVKNGYTFTGWSLDSECPSAKIFTNSIMVNESNTYYACFVINASTNKNSNFLTVGLIVVMIWGGTISLICYLIKKFKKTNQSN